jgi:hypothetical protein
LTLAILLYTRSTDSGWLCALGAAAGAFLFVRGFQLLARRRLIENTPSSKIRSASLGPVELSGLAVGPYTILAPVTGVPCFLHRTTVWEMQKSGDDKNWEKVVDESWHVPFFLDDNSGRVLVNPQGAELDIHRDFRQEFNNGVFSASAEEPPNLASFLARHGISTDKRVKVEEYCIKPKNALFVLGTLAENPGVKVTPDPTPAQAAGDLKFTFHLPSLSLATFGGRDTDCDFLNTDAAGSRTMSAPQRAPKEVVRLAGTTMPATAADMTQQGKIAAAMMKAGITNPAAWEAAGMPQVAGLAARSGSAGVAVAPAEDFDLSPKTVLMKGAHRPTFLISWRGRREVLSSLGWKCSLMIWGGPALTLVCLYMLAARFGWL